MINQKVSLFTRNSILFSLLSATSYLLLSYFLIGFKTDQLVLILIFTSAFFASPVSRKFITGFSIFIVYWILFDYMKAFPNYRYNAVHISDLYNAEKSWFGILDNGIRVTPNEYWVRHGSIALTILSGIFYLCWIPVPLAFAAYLFFKNKTLFLQFSLTFVLVNMIGFVVYYIYPAAPPWYYQLHGANFIQATPGNTGGLHKFDEYFNMRIFGSIYEKSSNVFAAMPSLHSSYPVIVFYYGMRQRVGWVMSLVFAIVALGIWFAAVYTSHHYVLDVLAGICSAIAGILFFEKVLLRNNSFTKFLSYFKAAI